MRKIEKLFSSKNAFLSLRKYEYFSVHYSYYFYRFKKSASNSYEFGLLDCVDDHDS